jgi:hypothetical protein
VSDVLRMSSDLQLVMSHVHSHVWKEDQRVVLPATKVLCGVMKRVAEILMSANILT